MAGVYIHIPFCLSKCAYCAFYSIATQRDKEAFLLAIKREMAARKNYLNEKIETLYFGGGTPSLLSPDEIEGLIADIKQNFTVAADAEITLEANPDTLSQDYLKALRETGVNRLSIGIQRFFDDELRYLRRRHDSKHARACIDWAYNAGFDNISIDLIYGLPVGGVEQWNRNLDLFFKTGAPHLSAYALTLEPKTLLYRQVELGKSPPPTEESAVQDYERLVRQTTEKGLFHYEISNFALPQKYAQHNLNYWNRTHYLGLGPSAHSYDGLSRQWNVSDLRQYIRLAGLSDAVYEKETLTPQQHYNEYVMTSLRTAWGCDLKYLKRELGSVYAEYCLKQAERLIAKGRLSHTNEFLYLNDRQMLFADGVAAELFWDT